MTKNKHVCTLSLRQTSHLPRLAPNAHWLRKFIRFFWKKFLVNPNHFKCREIFRNKSTIWAEMRNQAKSRYFFVIHPLSTFSLVYKAMFFCIWVTTLIVEPLVLFAYDYISDEYVTLQNFILIPLRAVMILLHFNLGYIDAKTNIPIIIPKKIICRYLMSYFVFDLMTTYWVYGVLAVMINSEILVLPAELSIRLQIIIEILCLACCCMRINTLFNYMDNILVILRCHKLLKYVFINSLRTFLYLHLFSLLLYFVSYAMYDGHWPERSWLYQAEFDENSSMLHLYFESFITTTCYFFGVTERHNIDLVDEEICIILISLFGRLYTLFLLADILTLFGITEVSQSEYERRKAFLQKYMAMEDLPLSLRRRIITYYTYKFQGRYFDETGILNVLSDALRTELHLFAANKLIRKVGILNKLPSYTLGSMIADMVTETYSPNDVIVKAMSKSDKIYFISNGTVAVKNIQGDELCHLEDGDEFGSSCLIFTKGYRYSVVAVETTEVFVIDKNAFIRLLFPHPKVMEEFYMSTRKRMRLYLTLEENITNKVNLMADIWNGNVLEMRPKRPQIAVE